MIRRFISEEWGLASKGHFQYDFIDVAVNDDNLLFIDPCLIEKGTDEWSQKATKHMVSYFDKLFQAYHEKNYEDKRQLLSHAGEQNATRLGYGNGFNGKGNTAEGLLEIFEPLESMISKIKTINKPQDLSLLIPGFAEDGLSDLLTNILHDCLNEFTLQQMKKYGIVSNGNAVFYTWDVKYEQWIKVQRPAYFIGGKELLLIPKSIVRKNYLFGVNQYFMRIILERIIEAGGYRDAKGDAIPKKQILKSKRYSGEHWQYREVVDYTIQNNDALEEYHRKIPGFYMEHGKPMSDEELDCAIYGWTSVQSA